MRGDKRIEVLLARKDLLGTTEFPHPWCGAPLPPAVAANLWVHQAPGSRSHE